MLIGRKSLNLSPPAGNLPVRSVADNKKRIKKPEGVPVRILVIGSGGREHALIWKLRQFSSHTLFAAPGNGGTAALAEHVDLRADAVGDIVAFARAEKIDLVVPGPELPLTLGITDALDEAGIACFGPDAYCARLEGSKSFAKEVMREAGVPTAPCAVFTELAAAGDYARRKGAPLVIKADGLAAGKGVVVALTLEEAFAALDGMMERKVHGAAGDTVLIEEYLTGEEVSLLCLCDGERALPLPSARDHKAVFDGDKGPNTGGMGAYSPASVLPDEELESVADLVVRPVLRLLAERGHPFRGVLYAGLMMTAGGPKVLEYNVRFGDPECQPLLMRLESDPAELMLACLGRGPAGARPVWTPGAALGVVVSAAGYPGEYPKGMEIEGLEEASADPRVLIFHSGTARRGGKLVAVGGRVLCVTALGGTTADARARAYAAAAKIRMAHAHYRRDIGLGRPGRPEGRENAG
jgi:phosphoribosylamine--glycine ligase